jgi:hypothetical protein
MSLRGSGGDEAIFVFRRRLLRFAAQKQNLLRPRLCLGRQWLRGSAVVSVPRQSLGTRDNNWIPACAGMTERFVSAFMLSARAMVNSQ